MWGFKPKPPPLPSIDSLFLREMTNALQQSYHELQQAKLDRAALRAEMKALEQSMLDRAQAIVDKLNAQGSRLDALDSNISSQVSNAVAQGIASAEAAKDTETNASFDAVDEAIAKNDDRLSKVEASLNTSTQAPNTEAQPVEPAQ